MASRDDEPVEATPDQDRTRVDGPTPKPPPPAIADTALQRIEAQVRQTIFGSGAIAPLKVGRFVLLDQLGQGGMGAVHAAYDEQLDRKVAIKVLRDDFDDDDEHQQRLQREAQAMARLSHPNVATVHEVGQSRGSVFVAMEFIHGQSLGDWLKTGPSWGEVLEAFVQAGRGLSAAHEAGLVHRDFKPANAMRTDEGVVKVLDFGLARATETTTTQRTSRESLGGQSLTSTLTTAGAVMGTPAYMAPEQHRGERSDARADQYAFCIALWQGLAGRRPFEATTMVGMLETKLQGPPSTWPDDAPAIPKPIVAALQRGLSPDPEERFPSMEPLLQTLSWDPGQRRNRWALGGVGVGIVVLGGWALSGELERRAERCTGATEALEGIWDSALRSEVEHAFSATEQSYASVAWDRTDRVLSSYADDWAAAHTEACEASTVRGEQSAAVMDLRMTCLHRAAMGLRAVVDTLADADADVVGKSHELVDDLAPLSRCADIEALSTSVEPPLPAEADAVNEAMQKLANAGVLTQAGRYPAARAELESAENLLADVTYGPVQTELALREGGLREGLGEYDVARAKLDEGLELAVRWKQWDLLPELALAAMRVAGTRQQKMEEALRYGPLIRGAAHDQPTLERQLHIEFAASLYFQGKYAEAEVEIRAALAVCVETLGPDHPQTADARGVLGSVLVMQGKAKEAATEIRQQLAVMTEALGKGHPTIAHARNNLATTFRHLGELEAAAREFRTALSISEDILGPDHPDNAVVHSNLGIVLSDLGREKEAVEEYRRAMSLRVAALGPDDPELATIGSALGASLHALGKLDEAADESEQAVALGIKTLGASNPRVATYRNNLAQVRQTQGRLADAEAEYRAALAIQLEAAGPEHFSVSDYRRNLGLVLELQGKYTEAETELREALRIGVLAHSAERPKVVYTAIELGRVLLAQEKFEEAEAEFRSAIAIADEANEPLRSTWVCTARVGFAEALLALDRLTDASPAAEKAWADCGERSELSVGPRARAAFVLARLLWDVNEVDGDRARARQLAETALRWHTEAGPAPADDDVQALEQWLKQRRRTP